MWELPDHLLTELADWAKTTDHGHQVEAVVAELRQRRQNKPVFGPSELMKAYPAYRTMELMLEALNKQLALQLSERSGRGEV